MNKEEVQATCLKYGLQEVSSKIQNVQSIINFLNQQEKLLDDQSISNQSVITQEEKEQEIRKDKVKETEKRGVRGEGDGKQRLKSILALSSILKEKNEDEETRQKQNIFDLALPQKMKLTYENYDFQTFYIPSGINTSLKHFDSLFSKSFDSQWDQSKVRDYFRGKLKNQVENKEGTLGWELEKSRLSKYLMSPEQLILTLTSITANPQLKPTVKKDRKSLFDFIDLLNLSLSENSSSLLKQNYLISHHQTLSSIISSNYLNLILMIHTPSLQKKRDSQVQSESIKNALIESAQINMVIVKLLNSLKSLKIPAEMQILLKDKLLKDQLTLQDLPNFQFNSLSLDQIERLQILRGCLPLTNHPSLKKNSTNLTVDLLTQILERDLKEPFSSKLSVRDLLYVAQRVSNLQEFKQLQNLLRLNLSKCNQSELGFKEVSDLRYILDFRPDLIDTKFNESEIYNFKTHEQENKKGQGDIALIDNKFAKLSHHSMLNFVSAQQVINHIDFVHNSINSNPLSLKNPDSFLFKSIFAVLMAMQRYDLPLKSMVKLASCYMDCTSVPLPFLTRISQDLRSKEPKVLDQREVDGELMGELIWKMVRRGEFLRESFDHMKLSLNYQYLSYVPFTPRILQVLNSYFKQVSSHVSSIHPSHIQNALKIWSSPSIFTNSFLSLDEGIKAGHDYLRLADMWIKKVDSQRPTQILLLNSILKGLNNFTLINDQDLDHKIFNFVHKLIDIPCSYEGLSPSSSPTDEFLRRVGLTIDLVEKDSALLSKFRNSQLFKEAQNCLKDFEKGTKSGAKSQFSFRPGQERQIGEVLRILRVMIEQKPSQELLNRCKKCIKEIKNIRVMQASQTRSFLNLVNSMLQVCQSLPNQSQQLNGEEICAKDIMRQIEIQLLQIMSNLEALTLDKFSSFEWEGRAHADQTILIKNDQILKLDKDIARQVASIYLKLYSLLPSAFSEDRKKVYNFAPLSNILALSIPNMTHEEVLTSMKMVFSDKVKDYSQSFLDQLFLRYSSAEVMEEVTQISKEFLGEFARNWPYFLVNEQLISSLVRVASRCGVALQSEILQILAVKKNILHPQILFQNYTSLMKMTEKNQVKPILLRFLQTCAYTGFTDNLNVGQLVMAFRRIFKQPQEVENTDDLLNLLLVLALSNTSLKELDKKSFEFIEAAFELIKERFSGLNSVYVKKNGEIVQGTGSDQENLVKVNYFKSFESAFGFKKRVGRKRKDLINPIKTFLIMDTPHQFFEYPTEVEVKSYYSYLQNKYGTSSIIELRQALENEFGEGFLEKGYKEFEANNHSVLQNFDQRLEDFMQQILRTRSVVKAGNEIEKANLREIEDQEEMEELEMAEEGSDGEIKEKSASSSDEEGLDENMEEAFANYIKFRMPRRRRETKSYDSRSKEGLITEEQVLKEWVEMNSSQRHLLLYSKSSMSGVGENINLSQVAKAWVVLFHFKSLSQDSILYGEFNSIVQRNIAQKTRHNEGLQECYRLLGEQCQNFNYSVQLNQKCPLTGWPVDVLIKQEQGDIVGEGRSRKKQAIYFFLQDEMCFNLNSNQEEPLALQKLMLRHVKNLGGIPVKVLPESAYQQIKEQEDQQNNEQSLKVKKSGKIGQRIMQSILL